MSSFCSSCGASLSGASNFCINCGSAVADTAKVADVPKSRKKITETRCTCRTCGDVWHYGKSDELESAGAAMSNLGKSMMCCGGCLPAAVIPEKKVVDLGRCPKCGSRAVSKEQVVHEV